AGFHLVRDRSGHIVEREMAGFLGHARMEHDLQQQIAEFAAQFRHVVARNRVGDFVGFLDRIGRDRRESLRDVPFASVLRITEAGHDREEAVELFGHLEMIIYIMLNNTWLHRGDVVYPTAPKTAATRKKIEIHASAIT